MLELLSHIFKLECQHLILIYFLSFYLQSEHFLLQFGCIQFHLEGQYSILTDVHLVEEFHEGVE